MKGRVVEAKVVWQVLRPVWAPVVAGEGVELVLDSSDVQHLVEKVKPREIRAAALDFLASTAN